MFGCIKAPSRARGRRPRFEVIKAFDILSIGFACHHLWISLRAATRRSSSPGDRSLSSCAAKHADATTPYSGASNHSGEPTVVMLR